MECEKFKVVRTSDELNSQYGEILRYSDPALPDEDKPEWAKHSEFDKFRIIISGSTGNRVYWYGPWTQERDDLLYERRTEKVPWKDTATEIEQIFKVHRTTKSLQARLDSAVRKQHAEGTSLRGKVPWTEEQMNWLRGKAQGEKRIDRKGVAVQFEARFGLQRNLNSMRSKWVKMSSSKNTTDKGNATSKEETARNFKID
ncbi:hypothetical protein BDZ45DRAFT_676196 [Acephala macrosclerotiorum]|nr:hypothetical protein BDZ45DRAFT_676196 [Acephala macrosclerotiorum]